MQFQPGGRVFVVAGADPSGHAAAVVASLPCECVHKNGRDGWTRGPACGRCTRWTARDAGVHFCLRGTERGGGASVAGGRGWESSRGHGRSEEEGYFEPFRDL